MTNEDLKDTIDRGFDRMDRRFDDMNGRVRDAETDIARLDERTKGSRGTAGKWGGVSGTLGGLLGGFLAGLMGGGK